jgi:ribosomal subunit interface protein
MNYIISGKNIDVTSGLKSTIEQKLGKLERYFTPDTEIIVTLSVEKERQKIEVTIPVKGHIIRSEQVSDDMYVSIDLVEEVIERHNQKVDAPSGTALAMADSMNEVMENAYTYNYDRSQVRQKREKKEIGICFSTQ